MNVNLIERNKMMKGMKLKSLWAGVIALVGFGMPEVEARGFNSVVIVEAYTSCGLPIYAERWIAGYRSCGAPIWQVRHRPHLNRHLPVGYRRAAYCGVTRPYYGPRPAVGYRSGVRHYERAPRRYERRVPRPYRHGGRVCR